MPHEPDGDLDDDGWYDGLDPEGPSEADIARFGSEVVSCPQCAFEVYDEADICPRCGAALLDPGRRRFPMWIVTIAALMLASYILVQVL